METNENHDESSDGVLSVVATPIGNLGDMTYRAVETLRAADYVLSEDTRVTGKLLKHYEIDAKMMRYDAHASQAVHDQVIGDLEDGKHIALVSDAGTPGVSDPGVLLVAAARAKGARVETIPGPSAITAAVSIAGLTGNQFTFLGFVPTKKGRQTFFERLPSLIDQDHFVMFYESTHRIMKTLESLVEMESKAQPESENETTQFTITIARELTKLYEETIVGTAAEVYALLENEPVRQKGEFVVIVSRA